MPQAYFLNAAAWQKILLAERASNWPPPAANRGAERSVSPYSKKCLHFFDSSAVKVGVEALKLIIAQDKAGKNC